MAASTVILAVGAMVGDGLQSAEEEHSKNNKKTNHNQGSACTSLKHVRKTVWFPKPLDCFELPLSVFKGFDKIVKIRVWSKPTSMKAQRRVRFLLSYLHFNNPLFILKNYKVFNVFGIKKNKCSFSPESVIS